MRERNLVDLSASSQASNSQSLEKRLVAACQDLTIIGRITLGRAVQILSGIDEKRRDEIVAVHSEEFVARIERFRSEIAALAHGKVKKPSPDDLYDYSTVATPASNDPTTIIPVKHRSFVVNKKHVQGEEPRVTTNAPAINRHTKYQASLPPRHSIGIFSTIAPQPIAPPRTEEMRQADFAKTISLRASGNPMKWNYEQAFQRVFSNFFSECKTRFSDDPEFSRKNELSLNERNALVSDALKAALSRFDPARHGILVNFLRVAFCEELRKFPPFSSAMSTTTIIPPTEHELEEKKEGVVRHMR